MSQNAAPTIPTIRVLDSDEEFFDLTNSPAEAVQPQLQIPEHDEDFDQVPNLIGQELPEDCHIKDVLGYFTNKTYTACDPDPMASALLDICEKYITRDYNVIPIDNTGGNLSTYYPARIPYLLGEKSGDTSSFDLTISQRDLTELLHKAYRARCRQRFPVPVILYNGKRICRSATLAGSAEIYGRMTLDAIRPGRALPQGDGNVEEMLAAEWVAEDASGWKTINELQNADIALLKQLKVSTIVDLMVENRKQKLGFPVTSSEKVDKENKYHINFTLLSLPFPGCEFFKEFHDRNFDPTGLYFDWEQPMCDADLYVPDTPSFDDIDIDWTNYKSWDLITMTQNYIKYILRYLQSSDSGILIHCISGWDRTPLFISLLRLSLWADGLIHKSLDVKEMLFLTLAYDWMLFGHHLTDRLSKNEDILLFCFTALKFLMNDEFSLLHLQTPEGSPENLDGVEEPQFYLAEEGPRSLVDYSDTSNDSNHTYFEGEVEDGDVELPLSPPSEFGNAENIIPAPSEFEDTDNVEVPNDEENFRSESSLSNDAWQIVSSTGSVNGSSDSDNSSGPLSRRTRLSEIRRLFYRCYYQTITEKHVNYTNNNISLLRNILRNLNEIASNFASNDSSISGESEDTIMETDAEVYILETEEEGSDTAEE